MGEQDTPSEKELLPTSEEQLKKILKTLGFNENDAMIAIKKSLTPETSIQEAVEKIRKYHKLI